MHLVILTKNVQHPSLTEVVRVLSYHEKINFTIEDFTPVELCIIQPTHTLQMAPTYPLSVNGVNAAAVNPRASKYSTVCLKSATSIKSCVTCSRAYLSRARRSRGHRKHRLQLGWHGCPLHLGHHTVPQWRSLKRTCVQVNINVVSWLFIGVDSFLFLASQ